MSALTHNHLRSQIACGIYYFLAKAIIDESGSLKERMQIGMDNALEFYRKDVTNRPQLSYFGRMYDLDEFAKIPRKDIKSSGYVLDSIEAAVWCLLKTENYKDAMLMAANLGYDTDTVAAIAGGLAGLYYGYEGIPKEWVEVIQKREWIWNLLIAQGER